MAVSVGVGLGMVCNDLVSGFVVCLKPFRLLMLARGQFKQYDPLWLPLASLVVAEVCLPMVSAGHYTVDHG